MWRLAEADETTAGFTLIEVLVALAIVSISLSSIAALVASTARGTRSLDSRLALLETARTVLNAVPDREQLSLGQLTGEIAGQTWRLDVSPFPIEKQMHETDWQPRSLVISLRSPRGNAIRINTIRLQRRNGR